VSHFLICLVRFFWHKAGLALFPCRSLVANVVFPAAVGMGMGCWGVALPVQGVIQPTTNSLDYSAKALSAQLLGKDLSDGPGGLTPLTDLC